MFELNENKRAKLKSEDIKELLHKILTYIKTITNSDAGTIYLKDCNNNLEFSIFQNDSLSENNILDLEMILKSVRIPIEKNSQTLAVESFLTSNTILIDDVYTNDTYDFHSSKEFDKKFSYQTKSILSTPLINFYTNEKIGVLQLINKKNDFGENIVFTKEDEKLIYLSSYLVTLNIIYTKDLITKLKDANLNLEYKIKQRTKQLEDTQKLLIEQTNKDSMTNLYNRRYFNEVIKNLMLISKRENMPISIMMLDIDDFKLINDTYGHNIGDIVINNIADIFRKTIRNSDIAFRFGGEEFVIILPNTNSSDTAILAEKIRKSIESDILVENVNIKYTISIGISIIEDNDINKALINSDKALYNSKKEGKNKISIEV